MHAWYANPVHEPFSFVGEGNDEVGALLVHGFTGSPYDVRALGTEMHGIGIDAHGLMLPGMAQDIMRLNEMTGRIWRDHVETEWARVASRYRRTVLVGYSLGGTLAVLAAIGRPPDLLMLIAPLTRLAVRGASLLPVGKYVLRDVNIYGNIDWTDERVHDWYAKVRPDIDTRDPETQRLFREEASFSTRMLDEMRGLLADVRRAAPGQEVPTIILQGMHDRVVLPRHTREFAMKIGGRLVYREMPGDHYLPLEWLDGWPDFRGQVMGELQHWLAASR